MGYTFKNIKVWCKAHELVLEMYNVTKLFPKSETYGLTAQLRRSVASIPTNIVEGYKRKSVKDFAHFINMAESSLEETKYHIILAKDLSYMTEKDFNKVNEICEEVGRMLYGFHKRLIT